MDTANTVLRSAKSFLAGTVVSRSSGLFRDIAMAISFGSSPEIAAFMVAYRLANLFRRLLGEGNLQAGFIPHFASLKEERGLFFRDTAYSMGVILILAIALLELAFWGCKQVVDAGWVEIIDLAMLMTPGLFFVCLYALNSSLLQCEKKYFIPAVAPALFNLIWIVAVLAYPNVRFLSIAITLAFAGQWLITSFEGCRLLSFKEWLKPRLFSKEFRKLLKPLALGVVGIGAVQINSALDAIFARLADPEGPAFLWYAIRIQQLPLALFGIAFSGALLPALSRTEDPFKRGELLRSSLKQATTLMVLCTFGIFVFGQAGIQLLYGHGDFLWDDVQKTTGCLWAYGAGLVPSVLVLLLASRFYAEKNYRVPARASLISVGVNMILNAFFVFVFDWGAVSIAIATSLSSWFNAALLSKGSIDRSLALFFMKVVMIAGIGAGFIAGLQQVIGTPESTLFQAVQLVILGLLYLALLYPFKRQLERSVEIL